MIDLTSRKVRFWLGFGLVLCVSLFAWSIVMQVMKQNERHVKQLEQINQNAQDQAKVANQKLDSARMERMRLAFQLDQLDADLEAERERSNAFEKAFNQSLNKIDKNEKKHIPNATHSQQYGYLSEYRYEPY